ncbi:MAG: hypothetical protein IH628_05940, partial [Proteobacteria bacterium]|nr:hypothetical protein [Pseudomonadota bacterium]
MFRLGIPTVMIINTILLTSLLIAGAVSLKAQQPGPPADTSQWRVEGAPYQNVFAQAILAPGAAQAYGEPAIVWHNGEYFLIYDTFGMKNGPTCLMTSKDGVFWKEEGAILYPDPDHDDGCIECPDLRQYTPDGPFVLSYDAKLKGTQHHVRRFAVSNDLRKWEKLRGVEFGADERFYKKSPFYNQYSIRNPEGGWFAVLNAAPREFMGLGLAKTINGLDWECLPPIRVTGSPDQQRGNDGPACKAVETSGVAEISGRFFITGGSPSVGTEAGADIILTSDKLEGPYQPTEKNSVQLRTPQVFHRIYDLPGGPLSMPMLWILRDCRRVYHVPLFRSMKTDGESLWFTWWNGNNVLKTHPLPASLEPEVGPGGLQMLAGKFPPAEGLVLEAKLAIPPDAFSETNFALNAKTSADATLSRDWWPDGYFASDKAVDGTTTTGWSAPAIRDHAWTPENEMANAASKPEAKAPAVFELDLGEVRPLGSLRITWIVPPADLVLKASGDGRNWKILPRMPNSNMWRGNTTVLENLDISARYLRAETRIGMRGVGIAEIAVLPDPIQTLHETVGGLFVESKPGEGWAWLISRDGHIP